MSFASRSIRCQVESGKLAPTRGKPQRVLRDAVLPRGFAQRELTDGNGLPSARAGMKASRVSAVRSGMTAPCSPVIRFGRASAAAASRMTEDGSRSERSASSRGAESAIHPFRAADDEIERMQILERSVCGKR